MPGSVPRQPPPPFSPAASGRARAEPPDGPDRRRLLGATGGFWPLTPLSGSPERVTNFNQRIQPRTRAARGGAAAGHAPHAPRTFCSPLQLSRSLGTAGPASFATASPFHRGASLRWCRPRALLWAQTGRLSPPAASDPGQKGEGEAQAGGSEPPGPGAGGGSGAEQPGRAGEKLRRFL